MFCNNCGTKLENGDTFCRNCGARIETNQQPLNENNNVQNIQSNTADISQNIQPTIADTSRVEIAEKPKKKNYILYIVGAIIGLIIILGIIGSLTDNNNNQDNNDNSYNDNYQDNNTSTNTNSSVKGTYSREVFSNNSFDYVTAYDTALFTFNSDSTFEVNYKNGNTYKGTYEIYNGLNISIKCSSIKNDTSISYAKELAEDINKVSTKMVEKPADLLNTYLVWIELDDGVTIQPFVIKYDPTENEGIAVNIMGQTQGGFTKK